MKIEELKKLNIKIETFNDLAQVMDVILPGHSIDEDNENQLIVYTNLVSVAACGDKPVLMPLDQILNERYE